MKDPNTKPVTFLHLPVDLKSAIKIEAARRGQTIKGFVIEAIRVSLNNPKYKDL